MQTSLIGSTVPQGEIRHAANSVLRINVPHLRRRPRRAPRTQDRRSVGSHCFGLRGRSVRTRRQTAETTLGAPPSAVEVAGVWSSDWPLGYQQSGPTSEDRIVNWRDLIEALWGKTYHRNDLSQAAPLHA